MKVSVHSHARSFLALRRRRYKYQLVVTVAFDKEELEQIDQQQLKNTFFYTYPLYDSSGHGVSIYFNVGDFIRGPIHVFCETPREVEEKAHGVRLALQSLKIRMVYKRPPKGPLPPDHSYEI